MATRTDLPPDIPPTLARGRYQIERVLGSGGSATVLLALDTRIHVHRAIKLLHSKSAQNSSFRMRFRAEATAQAQLRHPNVLMIHDSIDDDQGVYLVMELADRENLEQRVQRHGPMPPLEAIDVGIAIGGALVAAHAAGVIHRDLKPANILVDQYGVYKLADFGIARDLNRAGLTQAGTVMGTWAFMSPEQRTDSASTDARSDIYAFGITLYCLLDTRDPALLLNPEGWPAAFANVPPDLAGMIQKCIRFNPEDRYQSASEAVQALQRVRTHLTTPPPMASSTLPPRPAPGSFHPLWLIGGGIAMVLLIGSALTLMIGGFTLFQNQQATRTDLSPATTPQPIVASPEPPSPEASPEPPSPDAPPATPTPAATPTNPATPPKNQPATPATPTPSERRVIEIIPDKSTPTNAPPPSTPTPRSEPMGRVLVTTIPSGATVWEKGRQLRPSPDGAYLLSPGIHALDLVSPSGEKTSRAVSVQLSTAVKLCYNFDTNSACGSN